MKRRGVLNALTIAGVSTLTGCLGSRQRSEPIDSIVIPEIRLYNWTQTPVEIDVIVTEDAEIDSWKTYRIETDSERIVSNTPSGPGVYSILANPPTGSPRKTTAAWVLNNYGQDVVEPPRVALEFDLRADGTFSRGYEMME